MKTYIITGCSSGLGYDLAIKLLRNGNVVVPIIRDDISYSNFIHLKNSYPLKFDITDVNFPTHLSNHLKLTHLKVDCVVFNAAPCPISFELSDPEFSKDLSIAIDTMVSSNVRIFTAIKSHLIKDASIIAISSRLGSIHDQWTGKYDDWVLPPAYKIAKAAMNMMMGIIKQENKTMKCFVVHPGVMATNMGQKNGIKSSLIADKIIQMESNNFVESFLNLETEEILPW